MSEQLEFGSEDWLEAMEQSVRAAFEAAPDRDDINFSYAETYTNIPKHLDGPEGLGYTVRMEAGNLTFLPTASTDVDVVMIADYDAILPRVKMVVADDPERWASTRQPLLDAGHLRTEGTGAFPSFMLEVHDVMARRTR